MFGCPEENKSEEQEKKIDLVIEFRKLKSEDRRGKIIRENKSIKMAKNIRWD